MKNKLFLFLLAAGLGMAGCSSTRNTGMGDETGTETGTGTIGSDTTDTGNGTNNVDTIGTNGTGTGNY